MNQHEPFYARGVEMQVPVAPANLSILEGPSFPRLVGIGDLVIDMMKQEVTRNSKKLKLSGDTYLLFLILACYASTKESVSREMLDAWVYGRPQTTSHSTTTQLGRVRLELRYSGSNVSLPKGNPGYKLSVGA
jgi:DNA-binding winged helix-turn-helix (wHTH) protein